MKAVILAGGFGTRLSEATDLIPKPMVEVDGKPILWHIMKIYSSYGYNEFIVLLGYKGYVIKEYFANYFLHQSDVEIDLKNNSIEILNSSSEPWKINNAKKIVKTHSTFQDFFSSEEKQYVKQKLLPYVIPRIAKESVQN